MRGIDRRNTPFVEQFGGIERCLCPAADYIHTRQMRNKARPKQEPKKQDIAYFSVCTLGQNKKVIIGRAIKFIQFAHTLIKNYVIIMFYLDC